MSNSRSVVLHVRVTPQTAGDLRRRANLLDRPVSWVLNRMVLEGLNRATAGERAGGKERGK